ncbi:hypothetical protein SteCoe_19356 [Stentor coeruleus]|uniref:Uncharacterized protein n=1 Tax=Stentor coeruleus TaxID=5963 RepID=A0A1R2BUA8_9CILI|nr:hypothetical protein SteCoe_19356 [Stentor coeruleus]
MESLTLKVPKSKAKNILSFLLPTSQFFFISGCIMELLLAINIIWSCSSTFTCSEFLPTISYLTCYRGHDRLFCVTMVYWCFILLLFSIISYLNLKTDSYYTNVFMLLIGIVIALINPALAVLDEANTSYYVKTEKVHAGLMIGLILASLVWLYITTLSSKLTQFVHKYIIVGLVLLLWSMAQWFYAERGGVVFNYFVEAVSEWIVVTLAVFIPYVYAGCFENVSVSTKYKNK